jgi:hypothetical protein
MVLIGTRALRVAPEDADIGTIDAPSVSLVDAGLSKTDGGRLTTGVGTTTGVGAGALSGAGIGTGTDADAVGLTTFDADVGNGTFASVLEIKMNGERPADKEPGASGVGVAVLLLTTGDLAINTGEGGGGS